MHRNTWMALAVLALIAFVATPAKAAGNYWESDQQDESMCQDMTGNWVMCDSMGGDGISSGGGGSAPGMNSCTSTKGCLTCAVPMKSLTGQEECATLRYTDGYCKCSIGQTGCSLSGACTYIGG